MKSKSILCLLCLCIWASIEIAKAHPASENGRKIMLFGHEGSDYPIGPEQEHRSIPVITSISASFNDNCLLELDFDQPIGEVEILISQDGDMVYSSSENIVSTISKDILLPQELSGELLLEIRGENGTYIYGWITVY